jgi:two-component system chemotaxis response regulator CheB
MAGHDIIVIGASAGGVKAVSTIASQLPTDLPAAVFVVIHTSPYSPSHLPEILARAGPLPAVHPVDGEPITPGRVYVAPSDRHLLLEPGRVRLTRGPRENRFRPAVDPLFRSAALAYGPRVVGVILTGALDDGAAGLWVVKMCGGIAIVQDPEDAHFPWMPRSALRQTRVDLCCPLDQIPQALGRLASEPPTETATLQVPKSVEIETRIAMGEQGLHAGVERLGENSTFACPECHGVLHHVEHGGGMRFRCHTGHAYTADALLAELTESAEESLWNAVRSIEETSLLMQSIASRARDAGDGKLAEAYERKATETARRSELLRQLVLRHEIVSEERLEEESRAG